MDSLQTAATSVYDTSKVLGSAIVEKGREVAQSDSVKSVTSKLGEISQRAYSGASQALVKIRGQEEQEEQEERETLEELVQRDRERAEGGEGGGFDPLQANRPLAGERSGLKTDKVE
jgi:hypothetical protein